MFGAVFLQHGFAVAGDVVHRLFDPLIARSAELGAGLDWKTSLQEASAAAGLGVPEYRVTEEGPDHEKQFSAEALLGGVAYGAGEGRSKKIAEQKAAAAAYARIQAEHGDLLGG